MLTIIEHTLWKDSEFLREKFVELYSNPYCTVEYYETYFNSDELKCYSILENDKIIHLIMSQYNDSEKVVYILNRMIDIEVKFINLISDFLLKKMPYVKKIQFDHLIKPLSYQTNYPFFLKVLDEDYIIELPQSCEEYSNMLSHHMRKHTNNYISKIKRNIGDFSHCIYEKKQITDSIFEKLIEMKTLRMQKKSMLSAVTKNEADNILILAKKFGFITTLEVNGKILAGMIIYFIGDNFFAHLISNDPEYDRYNVAHVCMYLSIQKCIELDARELHMLWGTGFYKRRFLGNRNQLYSVTIFRNKFLRSIYVYQNSILPMFKYVTLKRYFKSHLKRILNGSPLKLYGHSYNKPF